MSPQPHARDLRDETLAVLASIPAISGNQGRYRAPVTPPASGFPDDSNTGCTTPVEGLTERLTTWVITTPDTLIENYLFRRNVTVNADNVTFRNCIWEFSSDYYQGQTTDSPVQRSGTTFEDCTFDGQGSESLNACVAGGVNVTLRRCNIQGAQDGVKTNSGYTLEDCYIHDLYTTKAEPHYDCAQSVGANGITISHCRLDVGVGAGRNSCVLWKSDFGTESNHTLEDSLLSGGGYTVEVYDGGYGVPTGIVVRNNRFVRGAYAYGPISYTPGTGITLSGNVYDDTGTPI